MKQRIIRIAVVAVAIIAVVWIALAIQAHLAAGVYSGTVETREIEIGSKIGGRVTQVAVEEGQQVAPGAVLVRFEADQLKAQRAQAQAAVVEAQAELDRMERGNRPEEIAQAKAAAETAQHQLESAQNGPRPQEIATAQANFAAAQADAVDAESNFKRMAQLVADDVISKQQFDDARDKRDSAAQRAEAARQQLALLQAGTRPEDLHAAEDRFRQAHAAAVLSEKGSRKEDIDAARGRLEAAQANVAALDAQLAEAVLTAPANAVVETVSVRPGDLVTPNRIVIVLLEPSQLWVKIYLPETDLAKVHVGQQAEVQVDSYSGRAFAGRIEQIASEAEFLPRNVQTQSDREHQVFGAKVYVDNPQGVLKSGMSATVRLK